MSVVEHKIISTGGDFITSSQAFVEIPDTRLVFQAENETTISIFAALCIWGNPSELALRVDGTFVQMLKIPLTSYRWESSQVAFNLFVMIPAGVHEISLYVRAVDGDCPEELIPEGPREWSPRKKKKPERKVLARVIRSAEMPLSITAIVV